MQPVDEDRRKAVYNETLSTTSDLLIQLQSHLTGLKSLNISFNCWADYPPLNHLHEQMHQQSHGRLEQVLVEQEYLDMEELVFTCPGGINESFWDTTFAYLFPNLWERRRPGAIKIQYGQDFWSRYHSRRDIDDCLQARTAS